MNDDGGSPARDLSLLMALSALLMAAWSFAVPIFETPDEPAHWQYVRYLHDFGQLPLYKIGVEEAAQPPLYYIMMAPFGGNGPLPDSAITFDAQGGMRLPEGTARFKDSHPGFRGYRQLRTVRLITVVVSMFAVLFCYWAGREASGRHSTGLLAAGLMLLLPQFTFRGMSISNDALMTTFCALALYFVIRLLRRGYTAPVGIAAAVAIALAFLSKINAVVMAFAFGAAVLTESIAWWRRLWNLSALLLSALIVTPWLVRNGRLYDGDLLASHVMPAALPHLVARKTLASPHFVTTFPKYLYASFVGFFGWMNLFLPKWVYGAFALLGLVMILSFARCWWLGAHRRLQLVVATTAITAFALVVDLNRTFNQPQGRYLFNALPALAVAAALGLESWPFWRRSTSLALLGALLLLNVYVVVSVILPAYR